MNFKYGLNDRPPLPVLLAVGLQWLAVGIPSLVIIAQVMNTIPGQDPPILYLQKLLFVTGITLLAQILWGHRLPLILGPANIILVAILTSQHSTVGAIQTAMIAGGLLFAFISIAGLFSRVQQLFTARVVAVILLLVALAITPTILDLILTTHGQTTVLFNLLFALVLLILMMAANRLLKGIWNSTLIIMALLIGSVIYLWLQPSQTPFTNMVNGASPLWKSVHLSLEWDPGVMLAFLLAYLALAINDLGSIQSMAEVLQPDKLENRTRRGLAVTGLGNSLSGLFGIVGLVSFSYSTGIVIAASNASRYAMLPVGGVMMALAFFPSLLQYFMFIPPVIIGCILLYIMTTQVATGLLVAVSTMKDNNFTSAQMIGLPILIGVIIAFLPASAIEQLPPLLRTTLGNGFIVGIICSLILEYLIYTDKS